MSYEGSARAGTIVCIAFAVACAPRDARRTPQAAPPAAVEPADGLATRPEPHGFVPKANWDSDEAPWASSFMNWSMAKANMKGTDDRHALSWLTWGVPLERPAVGAIAVIDYDGCRGHVATVAGVYKGMIVLLGGNQSNAVDQTAFPAGEITAYRWPQGVPIGPNAYTLPVVRPTGAPADDAATPVATSTSALEPKNEPDGLVDYQIADGSQHLRVEVLRDRRIEFVVNAGKDCSRSLSGFAYDVYDADLEIDAERGVGYPVREYAFWNDANGTQGLKIRLSLKGRKRAKVIEWGYRDPCPFSQNIMSAIASDASRPR